jgi:hypothetical protein
MVSIGSLNNAAPTIAGLDGRLFELRFQGIHMLTAHGQTQLSSFEAAAAAIIRLGL